MITVTIAVAYALVAIATGWFTYTIAGSELYASPVTRGHELQWLAIVAGIMLGLAWPITVPFAVITAMVLR